jgi:HD-GYP domain-containing protein (c-di-GMP phosphodiesterase class II)
MGADGESITWPNLCLVNKDGSDNKTQIASMCAIDGELINIENIYKDTKFDFSGTKKFDTNTKYKSLSMLVVPMKNHEGKTTGVLQLLNKINHNGKIIKFNKDDEELILSLASQAAISISNIQLIDGLNKLLDNFIKSIATTVGEKSKYTGSHINKVAEITNIITHSINKEKNGYFKDTSFSDIELKEMDIAAWMHDIGKITTPEHIMNKATKLETIYDRINEIKMKFVILKKEFYIEFLELRAKEPNKKDKFKKQYDEKIKQANLDYKFIYNINFGAEFMGDDKIDRIKKIGDIKLNINAKMQNLLSDDEINNLSVKKGTLTNEQRNIINNHVNVSYRMLKELPFPKKYKNIPLIAGSHHKKVKGGGYCDSEIMHKSMGIKERILAVADVFEALSASDRPYRKQKTLSQCLIILDKMVENGSLDKEVVKYFIDKKLYIKYSQFNLLNSKIDCD